MSKFFAFSVGSSVYPRFVLPLALFGLLFSSRADQIVYTDSVQNGWENWSWATVNMANPSPTHGGSAAISVSSTNWQALFFHHPAQDASFFTDITFWVNGGTGGQVVQVQARSGGAPQTPVVLAPLPANSWRKDTVSLASLGVASASDFDGFWLQVQNNGLAPTFYVDDVTLVSGATPPTTNTVTIDAALNRHPISPLIYGTTVFVGAPSQLSDLNAPLNRSGGNSETSYNWQINAHNHANDWYFESLDDGSATPAASADNFVTDTRSGGAQPMLTIPMIEWLPKLGPGRARLSSYSIAKYGPQTGNDWQWFADAGTGVLTNGYVVITNDPNDANTLTDVNFQRSFVQHLTNRWGLSTNGGVQYYLMDNEHTLWNSTHRDVHPAGTTMQEIRDKFFAYASMVKSVDPSAVIAAPEEWGWPGYLYSGADQQWSGAHGDYNPAHYPDRAANGGADYMPWLLDQFRQRSVATQQRLLDYFTLHIYPQGANEYGNDTAIATQLARNRSTRALWDPAYTDASWINSVIKLIPRMKAWVATYYPGTKIGITEYNWGAEGHINGATAQADILGIFGRESLDLATRWTTPDPSTPTYKAMKMYRNYDGAKSTFGETSISAAGPNPDNIVAFAALRASDGALTAMVINKQLTNAADVVLNVTNFLGKGMAQVWQLTSANAITHPAAVNFTGNTFTNTVPAQSITLYVIAPGNTARFRTGAASVSNRFDFWLDAQAGQRYVLQETSNLVNWVAVQTNTLASNSFHFNLPVVTTGQRFYRAQWLP